MAIVQSPQYWKKSIITIGLIAALTACGGGGGSGKDVPDNPPPPPAVSDTTPDAFTFNAVANADVSVTVESNTITVDGINAATTISIAGGEYKIASGEYTTSNNTVTAGQPVTIRLTTSEAGGATSQATLTIGDVSSTFTVTTRPDDTTPDAFSFTAVTDAAPGSEVTSEAITVSGINAATSISVTGGEYSVDGADFTADEGVVVEGQSITVQATASSELNTLHTVTLTIGGATGNFDIATIGDTTAPVAEFMFPPPVSMTEGSAIHVRVKVIDEYSDVASAQIKLETADEWQDLTLVTHADGTTSWDAQVLLDDGDNILVVATEDSANNREEGAVQVMVHHDATLGSFPSADNPIAKPVGMALDKANNRLMVIENESQELFAIDINSGRRSLFSDFSGAVHTDPVDILIYEKARIVLVRDDDERILTVNIDNPLEVTSYDLSQKIGRGMAFTFDDIQANLMASNYLTGSLWNVALDFSDATMFSNNEVDSQGPIMSNRSRGITYDKVNRRYLLAVHGEQAIYSIGLDGSRSLFSSNTIGAGESFGNIGEGYIWRLAVDDQKQRLLALEAETGKVFYIDLETRVRSVISSPEYPNELNPMKRITGLAVHSFDSYAFVSDEQMAAIFAVDLVKGNRVFVTKN